MSPLRNLLMILMAPFMGLCEQMDWGDNLNLVEESDTIQGREHIKQLVMLEGDTSNLECQVAFTSHPVSQFRWKIDGKPETKKVTNSSIVTKNGEVFVEEHLVIENITESMDSSTVSCEYSKGRYGAGVEAILRVFALDIFIEEEVWQSCVGDVQLAFRESNRSSPAEETVDKGIRSKIYDLTKSDKITVENSGYSVILMIATVMANKVILAMNPKLIINGTQVTNTVAQCGSDYTANDDTNTMNIKHMDDLIIEIENTDTESSLKNMNLQQEDTDKQGGAADSSQSHTEQLPRLDKESTSTILETGVAGVGLAILGLALLSIIIFLGVCNTQQIVLHCTTTWRQPGLDRGFVDRLQKLATNRKQKTNRKQTENKQKTDSGVYRVAPATKKKRFNPTFYSRI